MGGMTLSGNIFYFTHIDTWIVTILLFIISYILLKANKQKAQKITHMILRLLFLVMFITGLVLVFQYKFMLMTIIKMLIGIWLIASMELILVRGRKGEPTGAFWIQFIISLAAVLIIGYMYI